MQQQDLASIPDLTLNLQSMSISTPGEFDLQIQDVEESQEASSNYTLLLKVACTGGTPRRIHEHTVSQAMAKAWGQNYYNIDEVAPNLFMAYFGTIEAMHFVIARQPWTMGSDNLLIERTDPTEENKTSEDYRFEQIYVPVRIYGIPATLRSIKLLHNILEHVGEPSDLHPLTESMLFSKGVYMVGTAKMKVRNPVKDRIKLTLQGNKTITAYIHYEKIGRIYTFCGIMFHSVTHCGIRRDLIYDMEKSRQSTKDVPFERFGSWMSQIEKIPREVLIEETALGKNSVLARYRRMFSSERFQCKEWTQETQDSNIAKYKGEGNRGAAGPEGSFLPDEEECSSTSRSSPARLQLQNRREVEDDTVHPPTSIHSHQKSLGGAITSKATQEEHVIKAVNEATYQLQKNTAQQSHGQKDLVMEEAQQEYFTSYLQKVQPDQLNLAHSLNPYTPDKEKNMLESIQEKQMSQQSPQQKGKQKLQVDQEIQPSGTKVAATFCTKPLVLSDGGTSSQKPFVSPEKGNQSAIACSENIPSKSSQQPTGFGASL